MKVTVIITSFKDLRILKTIDSLLQQTRKPDRVVIADGGSSEEFEKKVRDYIEPYPFIGYYHLPGRCVDTRRRAMDMLVFTKQWLEENFKSDILAWIDADEVAEAHWLELLVAPIERKEADFTGGPWTPTPEKSKPEKILNVIQEKNQKLAAVDQSYMAMGNSAWNVKIFKKIGNFDDTTDSQTADPLLAKEGIVAGHYVSEDFDLNIRAKNAGFKSKYLPEAIVYHDQSHVNTYRKLTKYFYNNYVRTAMAYFKNKSTMSKFTFASKQKIVHPFEGFLLMLKPIALVQAWRETHRCR